MKEKTLKDLLKILDYIKKNNLKEAKTLEDYIDSSMKPYLLKQLKDKSKNKSIQLYINSRYKEIYSISGNLESRVAKILGVSTNDLSGFSSIQNGELKLIKAEYRYCYKHGYSAENQSSDEIEYVELIRENITIGLLSPCAYVRSLAQYIFDGEFDDKNLWSTN